MHGVRLNAMQGMIVIWSGALVDIPDGWVLCDGDNGTPDLRNRFVIGAGDTYAPDDSGGEASHDHTGRVTSGTTVLGAGSTFINDFPDGDYSYAGWISDPTCTINSKSTLPPYYSLCYIMHL